MRPIELTEEDEKNLAILEQHHEAFVRKPVLSEFRVLALFSYEDLEGNIKHVIGVNCECSCIGSALCAERSCIAQLQILPVSHVRKVYIISDAEQCLTPGTLCREFLSSSELFTKDTPFIFRGCKESACVSTLGELYPFPSVYDRVARGRVLDFGRDFCKQVSESAATFVADQLKQMNPEEQKLYRAAIDVTKFDSRDDLYPIRYGAAILFSDNEVKFMHQHKTLEYGSSIDAVSKLITFIHEKQMKDPNVRPLTIVQVDQFGILHAPVARARAFLEEYGHHEVTILVHDAKAALHRVSAQSLVADNCDCIADTVAH